ncbi:hypothetical protein EQG79_14670 [Spirosoma sordidisoli]|uniref:Uncharacterized protein n=1 Tax=Spirosoma sordidisoli TaxID=2502893 RepID=A0A4Q2UKK9_9BACT|nr:hypothetical protein EQG79_14670 [Spirosoma sordidisoli]
MDELSTNQADAPFGYPLRIYSLINQHDPSAPDLENLNDAIVTHHEDIASLLRVWHKHGTEPGIILFKGPTTDGTGTR